MTCPQSKSSGYEAHEEVTSMGTRHGIHGANRKLEIRPGH